MNYKGTAADGAILLWRLMMRTLASFSLKKLDINANVGMEKPESIGFVYGITEAVKGFFKNKKVAVKLKPDYKSAENYLYGEIDFKVKFHIYKFVKNMMMFGYEALWRKNIRNTIWKLIKNSLIKK